MGKLALEMMHNCEKNIDLMDKKYSFLLDNYPGDCYNIMQVGLASRLISSDKQHGNTGEGRLGSAFLGRSGCNINQVLYCEVSGECSGLPTICIERLRITRLDYSALVTASLPGVATYADISGIIITDVVITASKSSDSLQDDYFRAIGAPL